MLTFVKIAIAALLMCCIIACTDASEAERVLASQGFRNIEITGFQIFGCSNQDPIHTGFRATGLNGQIIEGVVCSGVFFKGSTVRF